MGRRSLDKPLAVSNALAQAAWLSWGIESGHAVSSLPVGALSPRDADREEGGRDLASER